MSKVGQWVCLLTLSFSGGVALAHATGTELKTAKDCEKLASPEKGHCVECVSRARPHHYHPELAAGARCQPAAAK